MPYDPRSFSDMKRQMAERGGFEPPVLFGHSRFPGVRVKPLCHLSNHLYAIRNVFCKNSGPGQAHSPIPLDTVHNDVVRDDVAHMASGNCRISLPADLKIPNPDAAGSARP